MDQLTPFDEDFYPDILRGLSVYFDSPFVLNIARTVQQFRRQDLSIALNRKQIASKKWLIDNLHETHGGTYGTVWILGGWYGVLSALLFDDPRFEIGRVESFDVDPDCEAVAECLNRENTQSGRFKARTADMLELDYAGGKPDLIINTSCEHIPDIGAGSTRARGHPHDVAVEQLFRRTRPFELRRVARRLQAPGAAFQDRL